METFGDFGMGLGSAKFYGGQSMRKEIHERPRGGFLDFVGSLPGHKTTRRSGIIYCTRIAISVESEFCEQVGNYFGVWRVWKFHRLGKAFLGYSRANGYNCKVFFSSKWNQQDSSFVQDIENFTKNVPSMRNLSSELYSKPKEGKFGIRT